MALPYFLFAAIGMRNPSYPVPLIAKGPWRPLGWLAIVLILGLTGILIWISWKIASGWNDRKRMQKMVFLTFFWILDSLLLSLLLVAPAVVVILTSPVGRMLAG
jgi:TRAP-type C4-dicarboxylate transport system permease small subunit